MTKSSNNKTQKLYRFEVDQSVRIEELNRDTIIGLANEEHAFTFKVPRGVKRRLYETFRREGKPKLFGPRVFASAVALTIVRSGFRIQELIIDLEYPGYDEQIIEIISGFFPSVMVVFTSIGKNSPAHEAAHFTYKRRLKVNVIANQRDIKNTLSKAKDRRTVTPRVYRDSQPNRPITRKHSKR
ncbi:MAG: hypothetical protein ABIH36_04530 [bacterium]